MRCRVLGFMFLLSAAGVLAQSTPPRPQAVFQKVCGPCHPRDFVMAPRDRDQWEETVRKMITLGAKASDEEFTIVVDYLAAPAGRPAQPARSRGRAPGSGLEIGAKDKHIVEEAAAERGRSVWARECIDCHGPQARGSDKGANLIRSSLVLQDRYGDKISALLKKGHPTQSGRASLSRTQIEELAHFIHLQVYETLRGAPAFRPHDVVTGDAQAGAAFFHGAGTCATCHSPAGDLAGIGRRYAPAALQERFISPRGGRRGAPRRPVMVTVTPSSSPPVTGVLVALDDFHVALRDDAGEYRSWKRTAALKVVKDDPYAAHDALLEKYTDKNMHDLLAYLMTLK